MQTVIVQTTQNIDIEYEVAGLGERVLARLIDTGFFVALAIVEFILAAASSYNKILSITLIITFFLIYAVYDLVSEIFFNGQCFGKRIMKIKVISLNGGRPTVGQYLLRWLFRIVDFSLTSGLCALITAAVSERKQRVGDMVAGTTLIKTVPRTKIDNLVFTPAAADYTPVFTSVTQLSDNDVVLIHEVISNFNITGNSVLIYNMAKRIKQHLAVEVPPQMNDYQFLQTVVNDYSFLTANADV